VTVHNGALGNLSVGGTAISFARRFSFSRASRSVEARSRLGYIWYAIARRARTQRLEGNLASGNT